LRQSNSGDRTQQLTKEKPLVKIDLSFEDDVALFAVNGRLDSYGATLLDEKAARIAENTVHAVMDLSGVDYSKHRVGGRTWARF
jgi:hypothetical protein